MAKPLQSASIAAPGFFGLNTQESSITLAAGFALQADNCVIDKYGRLGARKGWQPTADSFSDEVTIASSSTTATVTHTGHGLSTNDTVTISGANESEYNGEFTITVIDADTYTYVIVDNGNTAATGTVYSTYLSEDVNLLGAHEFIDINGDRYFGVWSDNSFYIIDGSVLTPVTYSGDNTVTDANWQAATLNDAAYLFDRNFTPIYFNLTTGVLDDIANVELTESVSITSSGTTATVTHTAHGFASGQEVTISGATETEYNGTFTITVVDSDSYTYTMSNSTSSPATGDPQVSWQKTEPPHANTVLSAYGRLWAADTTDNKTTVYWSDLLDGTNWDSGTAGSVDLSSVLVKGNDEIVALGAHAGRLIIFCKDNVVIYASGSENVLDPANMTLVEVINGVGCISRDSVQNTGTDILFLAKDGLRSLGRLIQEKSQPMRDLSRNVRDDLVRDVLSSEPTEVKSVYSASEAFYLLLIPQYKRIYCFDMRSMLQDGSARVTIWDNQVQSNMIEANNTLYFTGIDGMSRYYGYTDNGSDYTIKYYTNYFDFGDSTKQKFLKRLSTTVIGGSAQDIILKVGYDYDNSYTSFPITLGAQDNAEYGIAEYNTTAEYTIGVQSDTVRAPVGGSGGVLQVGFEATIEGAELSIQKLDIYIKEGRIY